jgi:hypothetical protein
MILKKDADTNICLPRSTCTSSLYTLTYDQIIVEFDCSKLIATLGLSLFVAGLGTGPMVIRTKVTLTSEIQADEIE